MLFRPSFCCNCGEKIERTEWRLWTSRRFCDLCATDFALQDYAAKGVILLASVVTVFGVVRLFTGPPRPDHLVRKSAEPKNTVSEKPAANAATGQTPLQSLPAANAVDDRTPRTLAAMPSANQPVKAPVEAVEPAYICGAATKKGTPCSRRVKGNVRCWQHVGQPAMLPPEQLRASR